LLARSEQRFDALAQGVIRSAFLCQKVPACSAREPGGGIEELANALVSRVGHRLGKGSC